MRMKSQDDANTKQSWPDAGAPGDAEEAERTTLIGEVRGEPDPEVGKDRSTTRWHGGLDFALLVLRVVLGGTMLGHGLQKLFGLFGGPGIGGFAEALSSTFGFTGYTTLLSWITAFTETAGGVLLVLGLFTPLAAAGILGVTATIVYVKFDAGFFAAQQGFEYELLLAATAFALLFTGAGRLAFDVHTPWRRKPMPYAVVGLLLAAAASVVILILFR